VVSSDAGMYQCTAQDGSETVCGNALVVTGKLFFCWYYCT